ncbi:MAG: aldehyde dehydrogenase (NADP(+)), partial [Chitinophagales bacterium]
LFASLLREGSWVDAVIDTAEAEKKPVRRADLRKMNFPIGPVAVFGASNFPFAFSTAGGDTASALAAGNPVIVKASPAHLGTNEMVGSAILKAAKRSGMPDGVFSFVIGESATAIQLVKHPGIKAVGFTGSYRAGMSIYKAAVNERETPIPVYAEMSSINPVLILPAKLKNSSDLLAKQLVASITLGAGQFCTSPGLIFLITDDYTDPFIEKIAQILSETTDAVMLNTGITDNYYSSRKIMAAQTGVTTVYMGHDYRETYRSSPALLLTHAADFIRNPSLQNEIFGPAALIVQCANQAELQSAVQSLHGQLTGTVMGDDSDLLHFSSIISILIEKVGRIIFNGVPTGVEVSHAMVHGGPFPATTDARTTSVGAEAIKRFIRPLCFQDCPAALLPDELKDENPANIMRKINGHFTKNKIELA